MAEHTVAENHAVRYGPGQHDIAYEGETVELEDHEADELYAVGVLESDEFKAQYLQARRLSDGDDGVTAEEIDREAELDALDPDVRADAEANAFGTGGGANASNPALTPEVIQEAKAAADSDEEKGKGGARARSRRTAQSGSSRRKGTGEGGQNAAQNEGQKADPTSPGR